MRAVLENILNYTYESSGQLSTSGLHHEFPALSKTMSCTTRKTQFKIISLFNDSNNNFNLSILLT